jgi:hypothetical protein
MNLKIIELAVIGTTALIGKPHPPQNPTLPLIFLLFCSHWALGRGCILPCFTNRNGWFYSRMMV